MNYEMISNITYSFTIVIMNTLDILFPYTIEGTQLLILGTMKKKGV